MGFGGRFCVAGTAVLAATAGLKKEKATLVRTEAPRLLRDELLEVCQK